MKTVPKLRAWQQEALDAYKETYPQDWLVTATPGAGKTTYALATARELWDEGRIRRLVVVTPTDHLRRQWVEAGQAMGFDLRSTPNNEKLPPDADGAVVTYAQVAVYPRVHEARTLNRPTLVVFDEVHHAGDQLSWGTGVIDAFDEARHRLSITGTPFRSDNAQIPNVRYEPDGEGGLQSAADYTYGYREALADHVVRPVVFAAYSGTSTWRNSAGEVRSGLLGSVSLSRADEEMAWKTALDPDGEWIPHVFGALANRIEDLRASTIPDAAGMVLASNQQVARQYADVWESVAGYRPLLIVSDDPDASDNITRLRDDSSIKAAISVRMVSEGVDVPRVAAMVVATTASTPLFFAQAIGRAVRSRRRGETATVFLPAVRHLLGLAASLEVQRDHVIDPPQDADDLDMPGDEDYERPDPGDAATWEAISSEASFDQVIASKRDHAASRPSSDDSSSAEDGQDVDGDVLGLPGLLSAEQEAALLARHDEQLRTTAQAAAARRRALQREAEAAQERDQVAAQWSGARAGALTRPAGPSGRSASGPDIDSVGADAADLRRRIAAAVMGYAQAKDLPAKEAWSVLYAKTPGPKNAEASLKLLQWRLDTIRRLG